MLKRMLSFVLAITMLVTMIPAEALAAEDKIDPRIDTSDLSVTGTNGFGTLLSNALTEQQETSEGESAQYEAGYTISDVVIAGNTATVSYSALEAVHLTVALYSEDGIQLLTSASATVSAEDTVAVLSFEGQMPQYFMVSVYLMDTYDYSPLCPAYDTPMYTKEMQELLASTVEDYDEELVLNLDDDATTNFAVYTETTKIIDYAEGVNTVAGIDEETASYVIENADEQFTGLQVGDVFAYAYGQEEMLIAKVGTIDVDGTTVTITGAELEVSEVFSHMKIEAEGKGEEATVDPSTAAEGITYTDDDASTYSLRGRAAEGSKANEFKFGIALKMIDFGPDEAKLTLTGSMTIFGKFAIEYYISPTHQRINVDLNYGIKMEAEAKISSKWGGKIPLGLLYLPVIPGLSVEFQPSLVVEFDASITISIEYSAEMGFYVEHSRKGFKCNGYSKPPVYETDMEVEGSIFIGLELAPAIEVIYVADLEVRGQLGIEIVGKVDFYQNKPNGELNHPCSGCIDGEINFVLNTSIAMQLFNLESLTAELRLFNLSRKLTDWYRCLSHGGSKIYWGTCPDKQYRLTVCVTDKEGTVLHNALVQVNDEMKYSDEKGLAVFYFCEGDYLITAKSGEQEISESVILKEAMLVRLDGLEGPVFDPETALDIVPVASGTCGANGDNVIWTLYGNGLLKLEGEGLTASYSSASKIPWYSQRKNVTKVTMSQGITNVGVQLFYGCTNMESIELPEGLTTIEMGAFYDCASLTEIKLPQSLTTIGNTAFGGCKKLVRIRIPDGVVSFGTGVFSKCESLSDIELPGKITTIPNNTFSGCIGLTYISIPEGITAIGKNAFNGCRNLSLIQFREGLISIGESAFSSTGITELLLPDSLRSIDAWAFSSCDSLETVVLGDNITTMGDYAFTNCPNLKYLKIKDRTNGSGTVIGNYAFEACGLWSIILGTGVVKIGNSAFRACDKFGLIVIPESVEQIGKNVFDSCLGLKEIDVAANNPNYCDIDGVLYTRDMATLIRMPEAFESSSFDIPDHVSSVADGAFHNCDKVMFLTIPDTVISLGTNAFADCDKLHTVEMGKKITEIQSNTFSYCQSLVEIILPQELTKVGNSAFYSCSSLNSITIPSKVSSIGSSAFYYCTGLREIIFCGNAPAIAGDAFRALNITAYYPAGDSTWTEDVMLQYGGSSVIWTPCSIVENGEIVMGSPYMADDSLDTENTSDHTQNIPENSIEQENDTVDQIYGGDYSTETTDTYILKTAAFSNLVPGEEYLLLALVSMEVENPLSADNLLFIDQKAAGEDGSLVFEYVQRVSTDVSYVVACGASGKNLKDAIITFPEMTANGELQVVEPTVVYDGETLTVGIDYVIVGTVDYTEAGEYTCYIRGIHNYTGLAECTYTVGSTDLDYAITYTQASISLAGDIGLNYYATLSEDLMADEGAYMVFTVAGEEQIVPISEAIISTGKEGELIYRFSCAVPARMMSEQVVGQMYASDGTAVGEAKAFSVKAYCDKAIAAYGSYTQYADLVNLMKAMLNYGGYSQIKFGYNTGNLANADLEDKSLPDVTAADLDEFAHGKSGSEAGISIRQVSLLLESTTTIRYYFLLDGSKPIESYTFIVDGEAVEPVLYSGNTYYVDKVGVPARELDVNSYVEVGGLTVWYSGMSYVRQVLSSSTDAALIDVCRALYAYSEAANAYFK